MSEKWQVGIYLIHKNSKTTKEIYDILDSNEKTYEQKQRNLLKRLEVNNGEKFKFQKLKNLELDNFELYLFYRKHTKIKPPWKEFLKNIVENGEEIQKELKNKNESFILFLYHKVDKLIYAICGGYGAFTIQNFIDDNFGIEILARLAKDKNEKILKSAKEFGITGSIAGIAKYFRNEYNFYENDNFGNIYKEISAYIDKETASKLGLENEETKQCIAKNSFKLNQSITFDEMIKIVSNLNNLLKEDPNFPINEIKLLNSKKDESLIKNLQTKILKLLYENKNNLNFFAENFEFYHKDLEKFLLADKYKCCTYEFEKDNLLKQIVQNFKSKTQNDFEKHILSKEVFSYDEEGNLLTKDTIFNHLINEFEYNGKNYFLINGKFYYIEDNFIDRLNQNCKNFIVNNYISGLNFPWDEEKEGEYNLKYKGQTNTIVLDTITPENIEFCDILRFDNENVYLYHVKKGFDGAMRDLSSQIFTSAERLREDILSGKNYLKKIYEKMQRSKKYNGQVNSEEEFLKLFDKNIIYVLAIKDKSDRDIKKDIEKFQSNIAKFELNELIKKMKSIDIEFKITQIKH